MIVGLDGCSIASRPLNECEPQHLSGILLRVVFFGVVMKGCHDDASLQIQALPFRKVHEIGDEIGEYRFGIRIKAARLPFGYRIVQYALFCPAGTVAQFIAVCRSVKT